PIAADQVTRKNLAVFVGVQILRDRPHAGLVLLEFEYRRPAQDAQLGDRRRAFEQNRLEVNLVDSMWGLGRWPPSVGAASHRITFSATGNRDAREFSTSRRRPEGDIVGIVRRQAGVTYSSDDPETTKYLHGARADVVAPHTGRLGRCPSL